MKFSYPPLGQAKTMIRSPYGWRTHPITGKRGTWHNGVDLRCSLGTPVFAVEGGEIRQVQSPVSKHPKLKGSGIFVIMHTTEPKLRVSYAHLSAVIVERGQKVSAGQLLGFSGDTGNSTAPHLHFRVRVDQNGKWTDVDPEEYLS